VRTPWRVVLAISYPVAAPALSQELVACATQVDPALAAQVVELAFLGDFRPQLSQLQVPTLLLQCHEDPAVPEEVSAYLVAHLPGATLVTLATTGHSPPPDGPGGGSRHAGFSH
jgi:sigma-B regulation protein RsbQ